MTSPFINSMLREEGRALTVALGLLTRIPMPYIGEASQQTLGRSLHWYPAAGLVIGLALALFTALLPGPTLPSQALLGATLAVTLWVALTGALHLDGLADCADAWVGGMGDRERTLAIMKDPACGPIGVTAVVLVLLLKAAALVTLLSHSTTVCWWLAPMAARTALPLAFVTLSYVRPTGMGAGLAANASPLGLTLAALLVLGLLALGLPTALWWLWLALAAGLFAVWRRGVQQRLGGFTGDCAGALVELLEVALLVSAALFLTTASAAGS